MSKIYITGHRNPDLDSLCAATAYANLKNMVDPDNNYIPIRCSHISDSVRKQMEVMEIKMPYYKRDVYPKVKDVMMEPKTHVQASAPIYELINSYTTESPSVVPIYEGNEFKGLLSVDDITNWFLTTCKNAMQHASFNTEDATADLRTDAPIETMMKSETLTIDADDLFVDAKSIFMTSHTRGLAVMDKGKFRGFVTRRCFLDTPKNNVILVDHNEPAQSVKGIETANVIEIIDHHRLDAVSTTYPIFIAAEPLGSTCTIVYQQYLRHGIMPDEYIARTLLTGLIADTLILKSPTTTVSDISTAESLARLAKVMSINEFGEKLFSITDNLATQDTESMILSDFKKYESGGVRMGVGQCEVTTLKDVDEYADRYLKSLQDIANSQDLDWTLLMITDVLREKSVLLTSNYKANKDLPYAKIKDCMYSMPGVMSRKKQLLPTLISATNAI